MAKLTEDVQIFIVQQLACFDRPQRVADAVKDEYGLTLDRRQVEHYDPAKRPKLPKKWVALHAATRQAFLDETAKEPAAHRAVRIRRLARMAEKAETSRNLALAKDLLRQIAEEVGDAYTNRRKLEHSGEVKTGTPSLEDLTDEELADLAARLAASGTAPGIEP